MLEKYTDGELFLLMRELSVALASLEPQERKVVMMRTGLERMCFDEVENYHTRFTLAGVSKYYHRTAERMRQIEAKALLKMRAKLKP